MGSQRGLPSSKSLRKPGFIFKLPSSNTLYKQSPPSQGCFRFIIDEGGRRGAAELFSRMTPQRVDVNVLDVPAVSRMLAVHPASALGAAEIGPIAGTVTCPMRELQ